MVWMEERKGTSNDRKRFFLGKEVVDETLPVIENESSACRRQDGTI